MPIIPPKPTDLQIAHYINDLENALADAGATCHTRQELLRNVHPWAEAVVIAGDPAADLVTDTETLPAPHPGCSITTEHVGDQWRGVGRCGCGNYAAVAHAPTAPEAYVKALSRVADHVEESKLCAG